MLIERYDIDAESSFAYSDHPTDAPMLGCVGNPVAVNPVHKMRRLARVEGWPIIEGTWQGEAEATQGEGAEGRSENVRRRRRTRAGAEDVEQRRQLGWIAGARSRQ